MPIGQIALNLGKRIALNLGKRIVSKVINEAADPQSDKKLIKTILIITGIILLLPITIIFCGYLAIIAITGTFHSDIDKLAGAPTSYAIKTLGETLAIYQQAQEKYNVSWAVLAAIGITESTNGTYPLGIVSSAGAVGWMQFMPATWSGWSNPKALKDEKAIIAAMSKYDKDNLPSPNAGGLPYDTDPASIELYNGYGTDGDGDGYADPYNPVDAIFSAAKMLKANLRGEDKVHDYEDALYIYGGNSRDYATGILKLASELALYQMPASDGLWPVESKYPITTPFGATNRELWISGKHTGVDFPCPSGSPLYAVFDGQITMAQPSGRSGMMISMTDGKGTTVRYAHLSKFLVQPGDYVEQGEVIGLSGSTGNSTGPHLHFEVYVNGQLCDPAAWLDNPGEEGKENY